MIWDEVCILRVMIWSSRGRSGRWWNVVGAVEDDEFAEAMLRRCSEHGGSGSSRYLSEESECSIGRNLESPARRLQQWLVGESICARYELRSTA